MIVLDTQYPRTRRFKRQRYFLFLLGALFTLLLVVPALGPIGSDRLVRFITFTVFCTMLIAGVTVVAAERKRAMYTAIVLAIPSASLRLSVEFHTDPQLSTISALSSFAFICYISSHILRYVLSSRVVDINTIAAAVCVYFFTAVAFASLYSIIHTHDPDAFSPPDIQTVPDPFLYFSLVTLTTLGYGDIAPVSSLARSLAALQAVFGQFYLTVLVARLVGLQITQHQTDGSHAGPGPRGT